MKRVHKLGRTCAAAAVIAVDWTEAGAGKGA